VGGGLVPWVQHLAVLVGLSFLLAQVPHPALPTSRITGCGNRTDPKTKTGDQTTNKERSDQQQQKKQAKRRRGGGKTGEDDEASEAVRKQADEDDEALQGDFSARNAIDVVWEPNAGSAGSQRLLEALAGDAGGDPHMDADGAPHGGRGWTRLPARRWWWARTHGHPDASRMPTPPSRRREGRTPVGVVPHDRHQHRPS
jgi:hypothetical protein